jgi:hypothetical protein
MTAPNFLRVFTFTLLLSGQAGEDWEPSDTTMFFLPPHNKESLIFPTTFLFHLVFYYTFYLSFILSLPDSYV